MPQHPVAGDRTKFRELMIGQASLRDLPAAYVIDSKGAVKVAVLEDDRIPYVAPPAHLIHAAEGGQVPLLMPLKLQGLDDESITYDLLPQHLVRDAQRGRVAALTKLRNYPDSYLYVARGVDPAVVRHLRQTNEGVAAYEELRRARGGLQLAHGLMYFMISLTALLAAIWVGLWFAGLLVAPIRRLISAAQEVARGNLRVELPIKRGEGDLRRLSMNFNAMTKELESQRTELVTANSQLTERRQFMEAVLAGVSAGVIGLDGDGRITLASRSAQQLLGRDEAELAGHELAEAVPEFAPLLKTAVEPGAQARAQHQVTLVIDGEERNFSVRRHRAGAGRGASRLGADLRRRHRARLRAAHLGLGRCRPPHRARDQEPAHADTTLGRAHPPQVRQGHRRGSRDLRPLHRDHHPPGRRCDAHGGRVLRLRALAQAADGGCRTSAKWCAPPCSTARCRAPTSPSRPRSARSRSSSPATAA